MIFLLPPENQLRTLESLNILDEKINRHFRIVRVFSGNWRNLSGIRQV